MRYLGSSCRNLHFMAQKYLNLLIPTKTNTNTSSSISKVSLRMHNNRDNKDKEAPLTPSVKLQQVVHTDSDTNGGWDQCWKEGVTPWDLGRPTPLILHLHRTRSLPYGRALLPGCGSGYDVVAIAGPERYVIGLDISENAINKAIQVMSIDFGIAHFDFERVILAFRSKLSTQLSSSLPNAGYFTFLKADFFNWHPTDLFDLIFDYTFFCAIEPDLRSAWAQKIGNILKPDGELITLIFPISDHAGGPPYKVSVSDYEEVLHPMGFKATLIMDNELAVGPRKGREKLGRWKRSSLIKSAL